jgi:transketolase
MSKISEKKELRTIFGDYLVNLGKKNKKICVISCDLKSATKTFSFFKNFPERSFEVGIAEANGLGIATGLALKGFVPIISSFGAFITGKFLEIRTSISYNNASVKIIGTHGGFIGKDGATQSGTQDLALMSSLPNFEVFQPCSPIETVKILEYIVKSKKPSYVRICRNSVGEVYKQNYKFVPGKPKELIKSKINTIISSGPLIFNCIDAIKILSKNKIKVGLININSIKPFNYRSLEKIIRNKKNILVVEDHVSHGGLSSLIYETIAKLRLNKCNIISMNLDDKFSESGNPEDLEKANGFDSKNIAKIFHEKFNLSK